MIFFVNLCKVLCWNLKYTIISSHVMNTINAFMLHVHRCYNVFNNKVALVVVVLVKHFNNIGLMRLVVNCCFMFVVEINNFLCRFLHVFSWFLYRMLLSGFYLKACLTLLLLILIHTLLITIYSVKKSPLFKCFYIVLLLNCIIFHN